MKMPGRSYNFMTAPNNGSGYRYGYNGKEQDFSFHGADGQVLDYGFRIYDARISRFMSIDPLTRQYPELTPYQFASNTPIQAIDLDGLEKQVVHQIYKDGRLTKISMVTYKDVDGSLIDQNLKLNGIDLTDRNVVTFYRDENGVQKNPTFSDNLSNIQQMVNDDRFKRTNPIEQGAIIENRDKSLVGNVGKAETQEIFEARIKSFTFSTGQPTPSIDQIKNTIKGASNSASKNPNTKIVGIYNVNSPLEKVFKEGLFKGGVLQEQITLENIDDTPGYNIPKIVVGTLEPYK
jgi:RHS repeat-associated protein